MDNQDKLIDALDRIKSTIIEVQEKFSEAAEMFNRRKAYDLTQLPNCQHVTEYIKYRKQNNDYKDDKQMSQYDKLIIEGDYIKDFITNCQARFLYALKVINESKIVALSDEEVKKAQQDLNDATLDIMEYNELIRRIYEVLGINRGKG
jgi:hypothetical protein